MADLTGMMQAAAGAGAAGEPILPQEVFSTTLYTGNGSTKTITNGIDLDGEGGLVWTKDRTNGLSHALYDTANGAGSEFSTNTTGAASSESGFAFLSTGYSFGARALLNFNGGAYVSWTFRKAPKFFDMVTYTGDGTEGRVILHNLGSTPGCIFVKATSATSNWFTYHRSADDMGFLNLTNEFNASQRIRVVTSASFNVQASDGGYGATNVNGVTYVAYLFAHDAGGFGDDGSENGISCGSYTGNGSATGPTVTLGYEPQWLMIKRRDSTGDWIILDSKRDVSNPRDKFLEPNTSDAEATGNDVDFNATSFQLKTTSATVNASGGTYIYVAIRADM
jgi:hypothetical protein